MKADGWDEAIEAAAAAIEQSALKLASSTLDLTANALGAASSGSAVSSRGRISASGDVSRAKPEAARVEEDIAKAKADIERAKTEVVAEAARLRKQLDDDTSRWAGTFAGQYAGDSRETSKSHVQDNMVRMTRFAGQTITGVSASSGFSVEVRKSNSTSVEIVMPAEWQQYLTCELTPDGVVQLGLDTKRLSGSRGLRINKGQLTAVVSLPKLSLLKCSSGAVIRCTGIFKGGTVQLRASSGGMVDGLSLKGPPRRLSTPLRAVGSGMWPLPLRKQVWKSLPGPWSKGCRSMSRHSRAKPLPAPSPPSNTPETTRC